MVLCLARTKDHLELLGFQSKAFTGDSERTYLHESILEPVDWAVIVFFALLFLLAVVSYFWLDVGKFAWIIFQ